MTILFKNTKSHKAIYDIFKNRRFSRNSTYTKLDEIKKI